MGLSLNERQVYAPQKQVSGMISPAVLNDGLCVNCCGLFVSFLQGL